MNPLFTIGHSTHDEKFFVELLQKHFVTAVADVRSSPYSKFNPQYNKENIRKTLKRASIAYVFLGKELGPRSDDPSCTIDGKVSYERLAKTEIFAKGVQRLETGLKSHRIAMMCAEKDPIVCHRMILVCRNIRDKGWDISHIREDGELETLADAEKRLLDHLKIPQLQLFETTEDLVLRAYRLQAEKIAYRNKTGDNDEEEDWL